MTPEAIARNRANAQKSTGPRTAAGKAVVAQNARRHGATGKPDPASIAEWLAIILDEPDLTVEAVLRREERGLRALALAEAEARLAASEVALAGAEAQRDAPALDMRAGDDDPAGGLASLRAQLERAIEARQEAEHHHRLLT